jgi:hypothetical protein
LVKVSQLLYLFILACATACSPAAPATPLTTVSAPIGSVEVIVVTATAVATTPPIYPWVDESASVLGICFEAANDMAEMDRRFLLRSGTEHIAFYDAVDSTHLCLRPVARTTFDFSTGRTLAGLWRAGRGCTARYDVTAYSVENNELNIILGFVTEGDCNYALVRPFWISFDNRLSLNLTVEG